MTKILGMKAHHSIISDKCRDIHGDRGAVITALEELKEVYYKTCVNYGKGSGVKIHIVMTVENPNREEKL